MQTQLRIGFVLAVLLLASVLPTLIGCGGGYALRGKVTESSISAITVVDRTDSSMDGRGVSDVQIRVYRDPGRLSQELVASGVSRPDGTFEIPISAFGAGWMDEEWLIRTFRHGYSNAEVVMRLPGNTNRRPVLIMLRQGEATPLREREDLLQEMERYR
jgi:hypothetical protein